jgi:hypothetical protein
LGEAKRRGSHPPTLVERVGRWLNRLWLLYPRPFRTFYRVNAEIVGIICLVLLGIVAVAFVAQWLTHR